MPAVTTPTPAQYGLHFARTIQQRFDEFDATHPEVFEYIVDTCFDLWDQGFRHYGMRGIWEVMRYHFSLTKGPEDIYKFNDHFPSRYARKVVAKFPQFDGFFEFRELRAE